MESPRILSHQKRDCAREILVIVLIRDMCRRALDAYPKGSDQTRMGSIVYGREWTGYITPLFTNSNSIFFKASEEAEKFIKGVLDDYLEASG